MRKGVIVFFFALLPLYNLNYAVTKRRIYQEYQGLIIPILECSIDYLPPLPIFNEFAFKTNMEKAFKENAILASSLSHAVFITPQIVTINIYVEVNIAMHVTIEEEYHITEERI